MRRLYARFSCYPAYWYFYTEVADDLLAQGLSKESYEEKKKMPTESHMICAYFVLSVLNLLLNHHRDAVCSVACYTPAPKNKKWEQDDGLQPFGIQTVALAGLHIVCKRTLMLLAAELVEQSRLVSGVGGC